MSRTAKKKIAIYDEGVLLTDDADSIDFTGSGVSGSVINNSVTEEISSSGTGLLKETPIGTIDDSNLIFTVVNIPLFINVNGAMYNVGDGGYASLTPGSPNTITLAYPVGTGGFIKSYY